MLCFRQRNWGALLEVWIQRGLLVPQILQESSCSSWNGLCAAFIMFSTWQLSKLRLHRLTECLCSWGTKMPCYRFVWKSKQSKFCGMRLCKWTPFVEFLCFSACSQTGKTQMKPTLYQQRRRMSSVRRWSSLSMKSDSLGTRTQLKMRKKMTRTNTGPRGRGEERNGSFELKCSLDRGKQDTIGLLCHFV